MGPPGARSLLARVATLIAFFPLAPPVAAAPTVVSMTFDDTFESHALAGQILSTRGLKGTFYVNSPRFGRSGYLTLAEVRALAGAGHDIGGHTLNHRDLTTLSDAAARTEVCDDRAALVSAGFNPVSLAYPFGAYDAGAEAVVEGCGYTAARIVGGSRETLPPADPLAIRTPGSIRDTTTLGAMQKYVTDAESAGGGWVVLVMHQVCDGCGTYSMSPALLAEFSDWIRGREASGTVVRTVAEVFGAPSVPAPSISSISPSSAAAGAPSFTLTVNGSGFSSASMARWDGADRPTTFLSSTRLTAAISASDVAPAGSRAVTVLTPGGGVSNPAFFTVAASTTSSPPSAGFFDGFDYPNGLVSNENPASPRSDKWLVTEGSLLASGGQGWTGVPDTALPNAASSNGTGSALFRALTQPAGFSSEVLLKLTVAGFPLSGQVWDGAHVFLRYQDANNFYQVTVRRRDGRTAIKKKRGGAWTTFTTPAGAPPLGAPASVRVLAQNQPDGSVALELYVGGALLARAVDAASPLTAPGRAGIGGDNVDFRFDDFAVDPATVPAPAPVLASISPSSAAAGGPAFTLTALGSAFNSSSSVRWNASDRATVFVSSGRLDAAILAADIASPATAQVTVFSPGPGGGASGALPFAITPSTLAQPGTPASLDALSPSSAAAGGTGFALSVFGHGFSTASIVRWNSSDRTTAFVSASTLTATIGASDIVSPGTATVTVFDPAPGAGGSNALGFTILSSAPYAPAAFFDGFGYAEGLITNENPASPRSPLWLVAEGSLFASGGQGWTGAPDTVAPNATSSNGTGSALFRALTQRSDFSSEVSLKLTVAGFPLSGQAWDGAHVFLRYKDANNFYQVTMRRRDGRTAIKKKRAGAWTTFTTPAGAPPLGAQSAVRVLAEDQPDGSVVLELYAGVTLLARAVDAASPLTAPGRVGVGGDNVDFKFDDFTVGGSTTPPPLPPPSPPALASLSPGDAVAGGPGFTLSVFGQRFSTASLVEWNGSTRTTSFVSGSTVTAAIPPSDILASGTAQVTVLDPPGRSNALAFTIAASSSPPPPGLTFFEPFDYPDGLLTNENPASPRSQMWLVAEGSLFASGGQGWTGAPDTALPNAASSNGTGSALFRALTQRVDFSTEVTLKLAVLAFPLAGQVWDGAHVYVRYQDPNNFYQVSVRRRDGRTAVKKKRAGAWTTFSTPLNAPPLGVQQAIRVLAQDQPDGSVALELHAGGALLLRVVDASSPLTAPGRVGIGGDNVELKVDDFGAAPSVGSGAAALRAEAPPAPAPAAAPASLVFPNPWRGDRHRGLPVTFGGLAPAATVRLYTTSGRWLRTIEAPGGTAVWDLRNAEGSGVAGGYFLFITTDRSGKRTSGMLAIIK